jgi:ankyrin repeat protein
MRWKGLICLVLALAVVDGGCKRGRPATSARSSVPWQIRTALHTAVRNSDVNTVRSLIAAGADVNAKGYSPFQDKDEVTPLHVCGNRDIAVLLIDSGAKINAKDREGYPPLHMAAQYHACEVARVFIEKGADVNAKDRREESPLYAPVATGDGRMVQLLIDAGADVRARNWQGQSLLHTAIQDSDSPSSSSVFALLIAAGADINAATPSGCTPLHYAARDGDVRAAELLLAHGADANAKTSSSQTPLHLAARRGYGEIVALLADKGADTDVKDRDGKTPLDYARAARWEKVAALLTGGKITEEGGIEAAEAQAEAGAIDQSESQRGPQTDVERLVLGNCAFAIDLYRALNAKEGNLFFSPYSISTALAMTYAGARENTEQQMAKTLHFSLDQQKLHPAFSELQGTLNKIQAAGNIRLCIANSLWPQ